MNPILVVTEHNAAKLHAQSLEALAVAQQLAAQCSASVVVAVLSDAADALAQELATYNVERVYAVSHPLLARYTADATCDALAALIARIEPACVVIPHTYRARDYAPKLATRAGACLVSDATALQWKDGAFVATRQLFQGKLNADYVVDGVAYVTMQAGAARADALNKGTAPVEAFPIELDAARIRVDVGEPFRESASTVDLTAAERIVAIGRGIGEETNLQLARDLAAAFNAELAASRPICDNAWLPMERQVGSSGQSVAPKLYVAVGISGAIQHLVGMKASRTIVAINRDPRAPIFEVADYAIEGDLFAVVPELIRALQSQ